MVKGQEEARIGLDAEEEIISMINTNKDARNELKECLANFGINLGENFYAIKPKNREFIKTDILLCCTKDNDIIGISLKTVKKTKEGFHQIDRRRLEEWKKILDMQDDVYDIFKESILRKAKNRNAEFIKKDDQPKIKDFIKKNLPKILKEIFVRNEEKVLKILAVYDIRDNNKKTLYLVDISQFIEKLASEADVSFSKNGIIQIVINNTPIITIQRKGGNGQHVKKYKKTDWEHPGNQLQFKMKPISVVKFLKENAKEITCTIDIT